MALLYYVAWARPVLLPWQLLIAFQSLLATYIWHLYIIATKWCENLSPVYVINESWGLQRDLPCPKAGGGQSHYVVPAAAAAIQQTRKVQAGLRVKYWKPEIVITTYTSDCFTHALFPCWFGVDSCLCKFFHFASGDHDVPWPSHDWSTEALFCFVLRQIGRCRPRRRRRMYINNVNPNWCRWK